MTYTTSKAEELVWDAHEFELLRSRYLDLIKTCLLRTVFPDANRNPEGETLPFYPGARREGRLYPAETFTMVGALWLESLERACLGRIEAQGPRRLRRVRSLTGRVRHADEGSPAKPDKHEPTRLAVRFIYGCAATDFA